MVDSDWPLFPLLPILLWTPLSELITADYTTTLQGEHVALSGQGLQGLHKQRGVSNRACRLRWLFSKTARSWSLDCDPLKHDAFTQPENTPCFSGFPPRFPRSPRPVWHASTAGAAIHRCGRCHPQIPPPTLALVAFPASQVFRKSPCSLRTAFCLTTSTLFLV